MFWRLFDFLFNHHNFATGWLNLPTNSSFAEQAQTGSPEKFNPQKSSVFLKTLLCKKKIRCIIISSKANGTQCTSHPWFYFKLERHLSDLFSLAFGIFVGLSHIWYSQCPTANRDNISTSIYVNTIISFFFCRGILSMKNVENLQTT